MGAWMSIWRGRRFGCRWLSFGGTFCTCRRPATVTPEPDTTLTLHATGLTAGPAATRPETDKTPP